MAKLLKIVDFELFRPVLPETIGASTASAWTATTSCPFLEQRICTTLEAWANPFTPLRVPLIVNLRRDPYEQAQLTSNTYDGWMLDRAYMLIPAQTYVAQFLSTFEEFPPRQEAASFSLDQVMARLTTPGGAQ